MSVDGVFGFPESVLLTRRARAADLPVLRKLLRGAGVADEVSRELLGSGGVLVLDDVAAPPGQAPLGAVALRLDPSGRRATLCGAAIRTEARRRGLGRRLLADCTAWLQAQGYQQLIAYVRPGSTDSAFLVSCGFSPVEAEEGPRAAHPRVPPERTVGDCRAYARDL